MKDMDNKTYTPFNTTHTNQTLSNDLQDLSLQTIQANAPEDLAMVSWPAELPYINTKQKWSYFYYGPRGRDTYIYVLDGGVNLEHLVRI